MQDFGRVRRMIHAFERARREKRDSRAARKRLGPIRSEDVAGAREVFAHFKPRKAPMPLVRIGPDGDGGYLLPDDLEGIRASFSPGVSHQIGFDKEIAARGIPCFLADASVEGPQNPPPGITFEPLFLGEKSAGEVITLEDWVARHAPETGDLLLQMDIEGAEYAVLEATSEALLRRFRVIVIEYHDLWRVFGKEGRDEMQAVFDKMARHFEVVHLHGNNHAPNIKLAGVRFPPVIEVTYLRRDRVGESSQEPVLPHPLDQPCNPYRPEMPLPRFWDGT